MKSKVKFAVLILVIGILGLVILASPVFGGPDPKFYTVEISGAINSAVDSDVWFTTEGNKSRTRFNPFPKGEEVSVKLTFVGILPPDSKDYDETETYPARCFRWSPLEDDYWNLWDPDPNLCTGKKYLQTLNKIEWEFHHIKISGNSLSCRFDLFYEYEGAWDHYVLGINMELTNGGGAGTYHDENATINWTHYTEKTRPRGKAPDIEFQQLTYSSSSELTITITEAEVP